MSRLRSFAATVYKMYDGNYSIRFCRWQNTSLAVRKGRMAGADVPSSPKGKSGEL